MFYSEIPLTNDARGGGTVVIQRRRDTDGYVYDVMHMRRGMPVRTEQVDYIDGEDLRDTKSRAIAAVQMLGYWPELRREVARQRGFIDVGAGMTSAPGASLELAQRLAVEQLTESGLILPPGVER